MIRAVGDFSAMLPYTPTDRTVQRPYDKDLYLVTTLSSRFDEFSLNEDLDHPQVRGQDHNVSKGTGLQTPLIPFAEIVGGIGGNMVNRLPRRDTDRDQIAKGLIHRQRAAS